MSAGAPLCRPRSRRAHNTHDHRTSDGTSIRIDAVFQFRRFERRCKMDAKPALTLFVVPLSEKLVAANGTSNDAFAPKSSGDVRIACDEPESTRTEKRGDRVFELILP